MSRTPKSPKPKALLNPPAAHLTMEEEVIFLRAIIDMIDSMVNPTILTLSTVGSESSVVFQTDTHQRLFNILLVDFLSTTDPTVKVSRRSFLGALQLIVSQPHFSVGDSIRSLADATRICVEWFEHVADVAIWLPSLDVQATLKLSRLAYLKMCGNIAKHDPLRLGTVARQLRSALLENNVKADLDDALVALDRFYERFHDDILNYHVTTIVERLNNIRWGIYDYLRPEFRRSYTSIMGAIPSHEFKYPEEIAGKFARIRYWELMSAVRYQPRIPRFRTMKILSLNTVETWRAIELRDPLKQKNL